MDRDSIDEMPARSERAWWTRLDPMSASWPVVALDVAWVVGLTALCGWSATSRWSGWAALAAYVVIASVVVFAVTALPLRYFLLAQRRVAAEREQLLEAEGERRLFEARVMRALDMAEDREGALDVAVGALHLAIPGARAEILLADSSRAHLSSVATTDGFDVLHSCAVDTPRRCPAVRNGHALSFADSGALDACPHLRARRDSCGSALCVPVNVMGSTTGVMHLTQPEVQRFTEGDAGVVSGVAQQFGSRIGLLAAMARSELQASTDPLTGLLNRRSLEHAVHALTSEGTPFAVVLADLDHFKALNDTYGHDAGDRALRVFSRLLRTVVRDTDLVCRYGGEEFLLVMPRASARDASDVLDRLRLELAASFADGRTPSFTVSAGAADSTQGDDFAELVTLADHALLQAKAEGRNRTVAATATA